MVTVIGGSGWAETEAPWIVLPIIHPGYHGTCAHNQPGVPYAYDVPQAMRPLQAPHHASHTADNYEAATEEDPANGLTVMSPESPGE